MEEGSDEEDAKDMKYEDFFDGPGGENGDEEEEEDDDEEADENDDDEEDLPRVDRAQFDEDAGDEDDMAERGILSSHQRQQLRLKKEITELEKEALGEKPWLLKGEVRSSARPENSLLEAILDYDRPGKVAPVITVEVSVALEDMIKKRILEDDFDDVIRKFAGNEQDEKKKLEDVSMEKSKEGLGEIYEKEYMKSAMGFEMDDESKQDQEEIDVMFKSLCWKLDALSNYQFTPKPMVKELQVKPSVPAIAMEEVVPISVSDANLKAPEEIYEKKRKRGEAVLQSKEEMSQEQRKALRNAKKQTRRKENKQKEADERLVAKLNPGLGNKYAKKKLMESISNAKNVTTGKAIEGSTKQFSNSKEFFTRLQVRNPLIISLCFSSCEHANQLLTFMNVYAYITGGSQGPDSEEGQDQRSLVDAPPTTKSQIDGQCAARSGCGAAAAAGIFFFSFFVALFLSIRVSQRLFIGLTTSIAPMKADTKTSRQRMLFAIEENARTQQHKYTFNLSFLL
jgi:U3 small nucleolar RNA-associated protein MPP10